MFLGDIEFREQEREGFARLRNGVSFWCGQEAQQFI